MAHSHSPAEQFADEIRLTLSTSRFLSEPQERALLIEALGSGLSLEEAREILVETVAKRGGTREITLDNDIAITIAAIVGDRGWISRTAFDRATGLYRRLSGGAISAAEAQSRIKELMLRRGWKVRGEIIFGTPPWFRDIPNATRRRLNNDGENNL